MPESVTTTAPMLTDPGASEFRVSELVLNVEASALTIRLRASLAGAFVPNGRQVTVSYSGPEATTLIQQLNVANLATKSLQRRILEKLLADGKLPAGSIGGTP